MKGLAAALTPPLPKENRKMLTPSPAAAVLSCAIAAGIDVSKRNVAPMNTILDQCKSPIDGSRTFRIEEN